MENKRIKKRCGLISMKGVVPSKLDTSLRTAEEETGDYREQHEMLEKHLHGDAEFWPSLIRSRSSSLSSKRVAATPGSHVRERSPTKLEKVGLYFKEIFFAIYTTDKK